MISNFWKFVVGAGAVFALRLLAAAAPLQRADVVANPGWLLHLDCDALRSTALGQYVLSAMDQPENQPKLLDFQSIFNFNVRAQLHGVTFYGASAAREDSVLIVYADFDPKHLVTVARAAKGYQPFAHGKYTIHSWIDEPKAAKDDAPPRVYAAIQGNHVIFGQRAETVAEALEVAARKVPSLANGRAFPALGLRGNGHVVEASARKMDLPDAGVSSMILRMAQSAQLVVGESRRQVNATATLVTDSPEMSGRIVAVVDGLLALAKLQTDSPGSEKAINALRLKKDGNRVVGTLTLPAADLIEMMKAEAARKAERAAKSDN